MSLNKDNTRPNQDILLTTALFAVFSPMGTFSLLTHHVHIQNTLRSWDLQPGQGQQKTPATAEDREASIIATMLCASLSI